MLRLFIAILAVGLGVVQYQLWAGRSSWFRMRELEASLEAQRHENERLRARNESLSAELYSLQNRRDAIEERARSELNMVKAGEVLFRDYGLSGIAIFDLSRCARPGDVITLDLTCGLSESRARRLAEAAGGCSGLLDPVIAAELKGSLDIARDLRLVVSGPAEPQRAQVTRGGLLTAQFDPATLEALELPGLFASGEALDVDGACGGFNLAWAWKSGLVAGLAATR